MDRDDVGAPEQFVEADATNTQFFFPVRRQRRRGIEIDAPRTERLQPLGDRLGDPPWLR
jgi:hypothetical protein